MLKNNKVMIVIALILISLVSSTVAFAYVGPSLGSRILSLGMRGGDVQELQQILNNKDYAVGLADGIFGPATKKGVTTFQSDKGLAVDGIVGPKTLGLLKTPSNTTSKEYTVVPGDSLYIIATKNNLSIDQLRQVNNLKSDLLTPGQKLLIPKSSTTPVPSTKPLAQLLKVKGISGNIPNLTILVDKSDHLLTLMSGNSTIKSYHVAFGDNGLGDKVKSGDHKTPEGTFYIAERSVLSPTDKYLGSRWMRVSYPNIEDAERGLQTGLIDQTTYQQIVNAINNGQIPPQKTALGGGIGIHGGSNNGINSGDSWTWGCVGLTNADVNEIYDYIGVGTKLIIRY